MIRETLPGPANPNPLRAQTATEQAASKRLSALTQQFLSGQISPQQYLQQKTALEQIGNNSIRQTLQQQAQAGRVDRERLERDAIAAAGGVRENQRSGGGRGGVLMPDGRVISNNTAPGSGGGGVEAPSLQQQRMELAQKRFALEEAKFNANANASKSAQDAQRNINKTQPRTPAQPRTPSGQVTQSKQPPKGSGGGGGGGKGGSGNKRGKSGGGGSKREKSPEQKAREKGRYDRAMDRQNRLTAATQDRRSNEEYAKSRGFNNVRAMEDHDKFENYLNKNNPNRKGSMADSSPDDPSTMNGALDRSKPFKNPYTDGPDTFANADEYEKWARERGKNDKTIGNNTTDNDADNYADGGGTGGRKLRFLPGIGFRWM